VKLVSDFDLKLSPVWFTGREWADGTAVRVLRQQYQEAMKLYTMNHRRPKKPQTPNDLSFR
jgi:hypothetical protein